MSALPALTLEEITRTGLDPALKLLPPKMDSPEARVQLLATALQESRLAYRRQIVNVKDPHTGEIVQKAEGPAKSLLQAEKGGGMVHGVRVHPLTRDYAKALYIARQVKQTDLAIWNAIEHDDVLAFGLGRLLLYADPRPLPALGNVDGAWTCYLRVWGPGKPKRLTWDALYRRALEFVREQDA
jgi:hypothetical protein